MLWRAIKAISAAIALAALLVGAPFALATLGGNPLAPIGQFIANPMIHDQGQIFIAVIVIVGWIGYLTLAIATIVEAPAIFGRTATRLPGLTAQQWLARTLLTAIAAVLVAQTTSAPRALAVDNPSALRPANVATATQHAVTPAQTLAAPDSAGAQQDQDYLVHTVQRGEVLITLAEQYYGDAKAMSRIADANYGTVQPDGNTLQRGQTRIREGWQLRIPQPLHRTTSATASIATPQKVYEVHKGDYLSVVSERVLGDPERYTEIAADNPALINDPDLIQPGWRLNLPTDAADSGISEHATGTVTTLDTETPIAEPTEPQPSATSGEDPQSLTPQGSPTPTPPVPVPSQPTSTPPASDSSATTATPGADEDNHLLAASPHLSLPSGGWIVGGLTIALASAWFLVQRYKRRFRRPEFPISVDHDLAELEPTPTVRAIAEAGLASRGDHLLTRPGQPRKPATVTAVGIDASGYELSLHHHLTGATVLSGPANADAARAIIAATLSSSIHEYGPESADLYVDALTLTHLVDGHEVPQSLNRLVVTQSPEETITKLEREVLYRRRILAEHGATDLSAINSDPQLDHLDAFVAVVPADTGTDERVQAAAAQGHLLGIATIILGQTRTGAVAHVNIDGAIADVPGHPEHATLHGGRMSMLTSHDLNAVLPLLAEAGAEEDSESDIELFVANKGADPAAATPVEAEPDQDPQALISIIEIDNRVKLNLLGTPTLHTADGAVIKMPRPKRTWPTLAYLASHPYTDHSLEELAFQLEPELDQTSMVQTFRTTINEIRKVLRNATGDTESAYISQAHYRYRLQPATVEVDLWQMHAHLDEANRADDDQTTLDALERAIACYRGDFATGQHHLWVEAKRTTYRNRITDALSRIAMIHEADRPEAALAALERAYQIEEPHGINEPLMQTIMRIQGRLNRPDSVKRTMQLLRKRLHEDGRRTPDPATERIYSRMISREPAAVQRYER